MFNKKFKKQGSISFHDQEAKEQKSNTNATNINQKKQTQNCLSFEEDQNFDLTKKYVKVDNQPVVDTRIDVILLENYQYLKELEEENRLNNYLTKKSLENVEEINIVDLENDGIYEDDQQVRRNKKQQNVIIIDETDNNLITDMDDRRMNMIGIAKQEKLFYEHNSDDEEFNRFEKNIIKSNTVSYDYANNGFKSFKFNDSQQMHYCSFLDNFSQINLESIIGNLQTLISQEIFKKDKLQKEVERSTQALQSSEMLIKTWLEQNQELSKQLREFELVNEYFQCFNDMIKQKIPTLFKLYDEFEEMHHEYYNLIEARIQEQELKFSYLFQGLPNEIILNYAKDICLHMNDVDEEYLDLEKICENYFNMMFVVPNAKVLQPIFDYHILLRFIELYCENMDDCESDLFEGLVSDKSLLCQLIMQCRFIKGLLTLNPVQTKFIQQFFRSILKHTYQFLKQSNTEEAQQCLNYIKSLLDSVVKSIYKKSCAYGPQIVEYLHLMKDILPKDTLEKLVKTFQ
ncbi:unnamed protein product (macronuclear) [Paramecium tetraurelia]|uniref:Uncharacterized protein n=1 Tax=Paramecium tetraurelia TaxID=5888 RepID=A0E103_PARTE|nr:uncharacterized protein GSPATT00022139001 [Paramecium tetraurelia]CAK88970.1 unnamed protein product [Paramecium tetraurelia]|eukprot:XP_001456367.1 hypothetical protein (macronuclear) [Paramecium tetraurelia strain d4-2]